MPRGKSTPPRPYVFARADSSLRGPGDKYPSSIRAGLAYWADWPIVQAHPDAFSSEPLVIYPREWVSPVVEQATAAPGEVRDSGRAG